MRFFSLILQIDIQHNYQFPQIILCHNTKWFDIEKAKKLDLSEDAIKFSLGYLPNIAINELDNKSKARQEFLDAYRGFTNVRDFYLNVTMDLNWDESNEWNARASSYKIAQAFHIWHKPPRKTFGSKGICYDFSFPLPPKADQLRIPHPAKIFHQVIR